MSRKKLPDHRVSFDNPLVEFTSEQIQQLSEKYVFSSTYDLHESLDYAAMFSEQKQYYASPPGVAGQRNREVNEW
jgi:hypothetical protein